MNVLLLSTDPVALDAVACKLVNMKPEYLPTARPGEKAGLGTYHLNRIECVGDPPDAFVAGDFDIVRQPAEAAASGGIKALVKNRVTSRPVINPSKCTGCGICIKSCPVGSKALTWADQKERVPRHSYNHCIRCYCCQEMCPEGAITVETPILGKLIFKE